MLISKAKIEFPEICPENCKFKNLIRDYKKNHEICFCFDCPIYRCAPSKYHIIMSSEEYREDWATEWKTWFDSGMNKNPNLSTELATFQCEDGDEDATIERLDIPDIIYNFNNNFIDAMNKRREQLIDFSNYQLEELFFDIKYSFKKLVYLIKNIDKPDDFQNAKLREIQDTCCDLANFSMAIYNRMERKT